MNDSRTPTNTPLPTGSKRTYAARIAQALAERERAGAEGRPDDERAWQVELTQQRAFQKQAWARTMAR